MRVVRKTSLTILLVFLILCLAANLMAGEVKKITKSYDVKSGGQLVLETDLGSVEIVSGSGDIVQIEVILETMTRNQERAERMFNDFQIQFTQHGEDVEIYAEYDFEGKRRWFRRSDDDQIQVEYYITVPQKYNISVDTKGGSIYVRDLEGEVEVHTAGGSLVFEEITGDISGRTAGGSIDLGGCLGDVDIKTAGGSIGIGYVKGNIEAHTSGGSITVEEANGTLNATTSGGSIKARLTQQPKENCRLTTSGGSVTVYVAKDISVDLNAETSSGHVDIDFPVSLDGRICDSSIRGSLNGGGPELYLRTSGGNIHIREI